jgi:L-methionine (R)-S-oxide reductase
MNTDKEKKYKSCLQNIKALTEGEGDHIALMSTISCEVFHHFDYFNWVGFYRRINDNTLKVGPYQGPHGCLTIDFKRGVCGACATSKNIQIENDVSKVSSHIACSSDTKAEIVLPVLDKNDNLVSVFDIDSIELNVFDNVDVDYLKQITKILSKQL